MKLYFRIILLVFIGYTSAIIDKNVLTTEVFEFAVSPLLFNWTSETQDQFVYEATLLNAPDLPSWIYFVNSHKNNVAYLYGVPPKMSEIVSLKIVALNKKNYETKVERLNLIISQKLNPAKFQVKLKIDNMNVQDVFDTDRMDTLKDIFKNHLWKESGKDLYLTFLNSAVEMGSRKPLNPDEEEGVVLKLGSSAPFSVELIELQEEVRPLYKVPLCPRHYKKTSVERYFRDVDANFGLDWCSFRLFHNDDDIPIDHQCDFNERPTFDTMMSDEWQAIPKSEIPERSYVNDLMVTISLPILGITLLGLMLSFILCFHDNMVELSSTPPDEFVSRLAQELTFPVEPILNGNICNGTTTVSRGTQCRPNPPPYVRPKFKENMK